MTIGERIKKKRIESGFSQVDFANKIDVSKQTLYKYENNIITNIPSDKIEAISKVLNLSPMYIMGWEDLEQPTPKSNGYPTVRIPVLGDVAAGVPILAQQDIVGYEDIPADMAKTGEYFGLKIKGDSMEPKIHDNDIVIVKSMSNAENNDIVIAMINNEAVCKRLVKYTNSLVLRSLNSNYDDIELHPDDDIHILGVVIESRSKF